MSSLSKSFLFGYVLTIALPVLGGNTVLGGRREVGTKADAMALHTMAESLVKYFKSLEQIKFRVTPYGRVINESSGNRLTEEGNIVHLSRILDTFLLRSTNLTNIDTHLHVCISGAVNIRAAGKRTVSKFPGSKGILRSRDRGEELESSGHDILGWLS